MSNPREIRYQGKRIGVVPVVKLLGHVKFDGRNREPDIKHISNLTKNFRIEFCQPLTLFKIDDNEYRILDGQHRYRALQKIHESPDHPSYAEIRDWEIAVEIYENYEDGSFGELLSAFNNRRNYEPSQIDQGRDRLNEIVEGLNEVLVFGKQDYIRDGTRCPYFRRDKLESILRQSDFYLESSPTEVIDKILEINQFLLSFLNPKKRKIWGPHGIVNCKISAKNMSDLKKAGIALSTETNPSWGILLDLPQDEW